MKIEMKNIVADIAANRIVNGIERFTSKHETEVWAAVGTAGWIATAVLAVKQTPKAERLLEEKKRELGVEKLTAIETLKTAAPCYILPVVTGAASTLCMVKSVDSGIKKTAAAYELYEIANEANRQRLKAEDEVLTEKQVGRVNERYISNKTEELEEQSPEFREAIDNSNGRLFRCVFEWDEQEVVSNISLLEEAASEVNRMMADGPVCSYASVADLYSLVGAKCTEATYACGWNMYDGSRVDLCFDWCRSKGDEPILWVTFANKPYTGYDDPRY